MRGASKDKQKDYLKAGLINIGPSILDAVAGGAVGASQDTFTL